MFTKSEYEVMRINKDAYNRAYAEAENLRQLRQAGLIKPGKLVTLTCKGLAFVGRWMVSAGQRLERADRVSSLQPADFKAAQAD